jgi:hypothetical protein
MFRSDVFISYSHVDSSWLTNLKLFLKPLETTGQLKLWDDTQIRPGKKWKEEIKVALARAKVAVLLVTQHFLDSDFITDEELPHFLQASENEGLTIFWIAVSASTYQESPIQQFQAANDPQRTLDSLTPSELNKALVEIAAKIKLAANP